MCFSKAKKSSHQSSYEAYDKIRLINSEYDDSQRRYGQKPIRGDEIKILMSENFVKVTHKEFEAPGESVQSKLVLVDAPSSKSEKSDSEKRRRSQEERSQYFSIDKSSRDESESKRRYEEKQSDYVGEIGLMSSYHSDLIEKERPLKTPELDVLEAPYHETPSSGNRIGIQRSIGGSSSDKRFISQLDGVPVKEMIRIQTPDSYSALKSAESVVEKARSHSSSTLSQNRYKLITKSSKTYQADEETLQRVNYKDLEKTRKRCIDRKMNELKQSERILFLFHMPLSHRRMY